MVRHAQTAVAKDSINLGQVRGLHDFDAWREAISGCGVALCSGIPVMQAYYVGLGRNTAYRRKNVYNTGMEFLAHGMATKVSPIHPMTRVSFFDAFGIPPRLQVELETHYDTLNHTYVPSHAPNCSGVCGYGDLPY